MRELTIDEIDAVSGAGFFGDLISAIGSAFIASADFLGFDGAFGYDGGGAGALSFGGFASALGDAAGFIFAFPDTVLGAAIGTIGYVGDQIFGDGSATISIEHGVLRFEDNPLIPGPNAAITSGYSQIFNGDANFVRPDGTTTGDHENAHTVQYSIFGAFFLPAYGIAGLVSELSGGAFFGQGNFFENGPYSTPPIPFR